ncbi:hypothetical protein HAX54_015004, partial [Datura stramonium]|nr:hypothetical protein [Datura stramonium]
LMEQLRGPLVVPPPPPPPIAPELDDQRQIDGTPRGPLVVPPPPPPPRELDDQR